MQFLLPFALLFSAADFTINTVSVPPAPIGQPYSLQLTAQDGAAPIVWSVSGTLPRGLTLTPAGLLSGTPSALEVQNLTFTAKDASNKISTANFDLATSRGNLFITTRILPQAFADLPYTATLQSAGGTAPLKFVLPAESSLPFGLALDPSGAISGTPNNVSFEFNTFQVTDAAGNAAITRFPVSVSRNGIRFTNITPALGAIGKPYSQRITLDGAPAGFVINKVSGNFPYGLAIDGDGNIAGTPLVSGVFRAYLSGRDRGFAGLASTELVISVSGGPIQFLTTKLPNATQNQPYTQSIQLSGGAPPFTYEVFQGAPPAGLTLSASGTLSGMPTTPGTTSFGVRVRDGAGLTATQTYTLTTDPAANTGPTLTALTSAGNYIAEGVVPGEVVVLFGSGIGPATLTTFTLTGNAIPTVLSTARVLFDGIPAPILYAQDGQLSAVAPFSLATRATTSVLVEYNGKQSAPLTIPVLAAKPALFTANGSGSGPGALLNQDGSVNTQANPAAKGSVIVLYLTGAGDMTPTGQDGLLATATSQLTQSVSATVGALPADVLYAGNAPGLVQGVAQINLRLAPTIPSGAQPIVIQIGQASTRTTVTAWLQ